LTFIDENQLVASVNPTRISGSPLGINIDDKKSYKTRFHLNLNNVENPKALTQGHKFYTQKKQDFAEKHQNLKRTELSRITELHMAGENSQQNIHNKINQQHFRQQQTQPFQQNQSRQLIHQDSNPSGIDGQQGGKTNKHSEAHLMEMDDNIYENSHKNSHISVHNSEIFSGATGNDRSGGGFHHQNRNQANSSQLTVHGS